MRDSSSGLFSAKEAASAGRKSPAVNRIRFEGEQKVAPPVPKPKPRSPALRRKNISNPCRAQGEARGVEPRAAAEAQAIRVRGEALRDNERVIELTLAQRWTGESPQTMLGNSAAAPFFDIHADVRGAQAQQPPR
jgi:hypothetical protein